MNEKPANILVVAAHPDDEALGCGGTIARHAREGAAVHVVFMTDGVGARGSSAGDRERQAAANAALKLLGAQPPVFLDFPDNQLDTVPFLAVVKKVEEAVSRTNPSIIYTHHSGDLNIDHQITQRAVMTACRPMPGSGVREIYGFEVLSSTEWAAPAQDGPFLPVRFVGIYAFLDQKLEALRCYAHEMREFPHSRSYETVKALAVLRGSNNGLRAAEAFTVLRIVEP